MDQTSKSGSQLLSNWLSRVIEGVFDGGLDEPEAFVLFVALYLIVCVVWVVLRETAYLIGVALSHSGMSS